MHNAVKNTSMFKMVYYCHKDAFRPAIVTFLELISSTLEHGSTLNPHESGNSFALFTVFQGIPWQDQVRRKSRNHHMPYHARRAPQ